MVITGLSVQPRLRARGQLRLVRRAQREQRGRHFATGWPDPTPVWRAVYGELEMPRRILIPNGV